MSCATLLACGDRHLDREPQFDHVGLPVVALEGELINGSPAIGRPVLIRLSGGTLWVADLSSDPGLHALDAGTGELLFSIGTRGEGPGEFSTRPFGLDVPLTDNERDGIWAWDMRLQRLTRFERRPFSDYEPAVVHLRTQPRVQRVAWVTPDRIIGVANSDTARFSLFGRDGRLKETRPGPLPGPDSLARAFRLMAANGGIKVCTWPGQGFAIANFMIGQVEYYDTLARFIRRAKAPYQSEIELATDSTGRSTLSTARNWYYDCGATKDYLFALFSGRLAAAYEGDAEASGEFIHVFDWAGDLRAVFRLDRDVRGIAVSRDGRILYATSLIDAGIYRYSVSGFED
jgi:hypothetical protein